MYHTILIPLDGSKLAENALFYAKPIVEADYSRVVLVRAERMAEVAADAMEQLSHPFTPTIDSAENYLNFIRTTHDLYHTDLVARPGRPASVIFDCERDEQPDLIIMSTHGRTGVARWALGSVASKVLQQAIAPVLLVRDRQPVRSILVPLDGSILAEGILRHAVHLAKVFEAELALLRVVPDLERPSVQRVLKEAVSAIDPPILPTAVDEHYLTRVARRISADVRVRTMERIGDPAETILKIAKDHSLVAMSTHGYSGVERYLFGSVTEKVMQGMDRPMLIQRPWL